MLDGDKTSRIFDNLYTNIIKYAMPDTRVYVNVEQAADEVLIELKNISGYELNIPAESLYGTFRAGRQREEQRRKRTGACHRQKLRGTAGR